MPTVLLVEDDAADLEIITRVIEESGFAANIDAVCSGSEALDYLQKRKENENGGDPYPNLIFLDLNLPGMSGFDILAKVKQEPRIRDIPVIVLSTSSAPADIEQCYALGASSFVVKPSNIQGFVDMMQQIERYWFEIVSLPLRRA